MKGDANHFLAAWDILENGILADERRSIEQQHQILLDRRYNFIPYLDQDGSVIAVLGYWQFEKFIFVEHVVVSAAGRNRGVGSVIISELCQSATTPIILEADPPELNDLSMRRIEWYLRQKFVVNDFDYVQPPYSPEKRPVPMKILSYPHQLTLIEFNEIVGTLRSEVYREFQHEVSNLNMTKE